MLNVNKKFTPFFVILALINVNGWPM
jgi:hypothetical protein